MLAMQLPQVVCVAQQCPPAIGAIPLTPLPICSTLPVSCLFVVHQAYRAASRRLAPSSVWWSPNAAVLLHQPATGQETSGSRQSLTLRARSDVLGVSWPVVMHGCPLLAADA
jgi:hypothetical protein